MKKASFKSVVVGAFACLALVQGAVAEPEPVNVPELMVTKAGAPVKDVATWENVRRAELKAIFCENEYGWRPVERPDTLAFELAEPDKLMMDGKAIRKRVRVSWKGPFASQSFVFTAFIPVSAKTRPVPGFILICNRPAAENIDPERVKKSEFWPAEEIVARGYAALAFWNGDVAPDDAKGNCSKGVHACWAKKRTANSWGALSAWAWGASRVLDWVETEPLLDAKHFGVVGHSRGGKTALLAGAMDSRFAMACVNDSGCSGAKLNHINLPKSESIDRITKLIPHWFCLNYRKFAGKEFEMDFDQHMLVALMAPRAVAIASASKDNWAGPRGEYYSAVFASPAWELYGKKGLVSSGFPKPGEARQEGTVSYHYRPGIHNLTLHDWNRYMDFADRLGWCAAAPEPKDVPELMTTGKGEKVTTVEQWEKVRASELFALFEREEYGRRPAAANERDRVSFDVYDVREALDGKAVRKLVRVTYKGPNGTFSFPFTAYIPKTEKPVPAFVLAANIKRGILDEKQGLSSVFWPVEEIIARGYATAAFRFDFVAADKKGAGFSQGIFPAVQPESARDDESWGTLSAWAWGNSRILDWMETEPLIDAKHVGVVGHSRGGKTAILTAVLDRRFAMACSNNSGCSGAKLNHIDLPKSEHIQQILKNFPYWFCKNYRKHAGKEMTMDFDQHELLALIAPRLLCVASATEDAWAGQRGEWWAAKLASPAWELYGKKGLVADAYPAPEEPQQDGCISYHLRKGPHFLAPYDWHRYMDFADRHGWH